MQRNRVDLAVLLLWNCLDIMLQWYALGLKFSNVHAWIWKLESDVWPSMSTAFFITPVCFHCYVDMVHVVQTTVLLMQVVITAESNPRGDVDAAGLQSSVRGKTAVSRNVGGEHGLGLVHFFLFLIMPKHI